jgi:hypothetical protein
LDTFAESGATAKSIGSLALPRGTKSIQLEYQLDSGRYVAMNAFSPGKSAQAVLAEDNLLLYTWKLAVVGGSLNQQLFFQSDTLGGTSWNALGKTGRVMVPIDVSSLTSNSDSNIHLMLEMSAVSGPGNFEQVQGDLVAPPQLEVTASATRLSITKIKRVEAPDANEYRVDSKTGRRIKISDPRFSIPRPSQSNVSKREYQLSVSKPVAAVIENVKVELKNASNDGVLTVVYNTSSSATNTWTWDGSANVLTTVVAYQSPQKVAAAFYSTPPPTEKILYEFTVKAKEGVNNLEDTKNTLSAVHDTKEVKTYLALWQIPDVYTPRSTKRYSDDDSKTGGDGWCSKQTYDWLVLNGQLIPRIGDISGEHGRNVGHNSHLNGNDIDIFQFFEVNTRSGGANYLALAKKVAEAAINGDATAKGVVKDAIQKMRTGLQNLVANSKVDIVYTANGSIKRDKNPPTPTATTILKVDNSTLTLDLPNVWLRELIETGKTTLTVKNPAPVGNQEVILDLGFDSANWAPAGKGKIDWRADHWDHIHVTLNH